ncbi:MAG: alpha/beta hydrolase [Fimbriimonadaceae bacterium]|nr:MAG: alpha/beta hydrolase [Fimbriimonadaceae bacterium]
MKFNRLIKPVITSALFLVGSANLLASELPRRGIVGLPLQMMNEQQLSDAGIQDGAGILVTQNPTRPDVGGIVAGDIILKIDGKRFNSAPEFNNLVRPFLADLWIPMTIKTKSGEKDVKVKVQARADEKYDDVDVILSSVTTNGIRVRTIFTKPKGNGPFPTLFWIQGISTGSVDQPLVANNYITKVLKKFSDAGYATMRVEKIGVGDSEGPNPMLVNLIDEVDVFRQGLLALKKMPSVNPDNITVFGHSMGGCIAPIICSEIPVKNIISYGTVTESWLEWQIKAPRIQGPLSGQTPNEVRQDVLNAARFYSYLYTERKSFDWIVQNVPDLAEYARTQSADGVNMTRSIEYMRQANDANYCDFWTKTGDAKVLSIFGENDFIALRDDQELIPKVINEKTPGRSEFLLLPGNDHLFRKTTSMADSVAKFNGTPFEQSDALGKACLDWLKKQNFLEGLDW